ncbi:MULTISPECIES: hypothetical protein [unclassified Actinomyces]|uniref:hypothetical protein n=1 Tax=unclassified Actinomyces TaxID=2609248 RepID=UPI001F19D104|nr:MULTISPECIES: hypothetical protein [unclassified Actinomyces]
MTTDQTPPAARAARSEPISAAAPSTPAGLEPSRRRKARPALLTPLTRLTLRRDRRATATWALGAGALALYGVLVFGAAYPTAADRRSASLVYSTPAARLFTGPGFGLEGADPGLAALFAAQAMGWVAAVGCLMGMFMAISRTRGDEDAGPGELIRSHPVGRGEAARAALVSGLVSATALALFSALAVLAGGLEAGGALVMALGLWLACLWGTGAGLLLGAVTASARAARGTGILLVLGWFALRGMGDADQDASFLSWLSPMGLVQQTRVWVDTRWLPILLLAVGAAVLTGSGAALHARRDLGEGLLGTGAPVRPRRRGPAGAVALALRTTAAARGWCAGLGIAYGATYGLFASAIEESFQQLVEDNPAMQVWFGDSLGVSTYLGMIIGYLGPAGAACAVALGAGAISEERRGAMATVLAAPVSRCGWLVARACAVALGTALFVVAAAGALAGTAVPVLVMAGSDAAARPWVLVHGIVVGALATVPACLLAGALVLSVHALAPRLTRPLGWGAYALMVGITLLGPLPGVPQWLLNLSPFTHVPSLPVQDAGTAGSIPHWGAADHWVGPGACLVLAVALMAVAAVAGRRRDLVG